ncbi:Chromosome partition protein smc [Rhodopirellula islandica]|uniref:Chromosome partition protein smc n=1 Tax=Rhodopirellula islandica TaxID=595434 RepID=A0A0J1EN67_RHOIS|nr:FHA domain-containing protein [Rhodopirellula islandica]KLU06924.1 Chromosome partition protein smc [Rhodopirellula islandica]
MATDSSNTPTHTESDSVTAFAAPARSEVSNRSTGEGTATSWLNQPRHAASSEVDSTGRPSSGPSHSKPLGDHGTMWNQDGAIEFRVRCKDHPTRRLRLAGARYTLGNGVGCSIRLDDPTLRPLHAVLIRDAHRILIRAYSIPLLINNVRVTEGILQQGDVLGLGNYEFELVQAKLAEASKPTAHRFAESVPRLASGTPASMFDSNVEFQKEAARWHKLKEEAEQHDQWVRERQDELQRQSEQLESQFKALREREDEIRSQETAAVELHAEFQVRHRELTDRQNQLATQQQQLETQREEWHTQQQRLQGRDEQYRTQIEELLQEKESLFERERDSERRLTETRQQLKASQSQADAAAEAVTQMRTKFASLNEQLLALGEQQESLQSMGMERVEEHARQCNELSTARDEAIAQRERANQERDEALDQKASSDAKASESQKRCDDLLKTEESLRQEIESLQIEISDARKEAEALRRDCQHARTTIGELEARVRESEDRHDTDRTSWSDEMDALRTGVDELTISLAQAEQQLAQLREDNDKLRETLLVTEEQRDEFKAKYNSSEKQRLRAEREVSETRQLFDRSNRDHDDTLDQIERLEEETRQLISGKSVDEPKDAPSNFRLGLLSAAATSTEDDDSLEEAPESSIARDDEATPLEASDIAEEPDVSSPTADAVGLHIASETDPESVGSPSTSDAHGADELIDEALSMVHDSETDRLLQEAEEKAASWSTPIAEETVEQESDEDAWPTYDSAQAKGFDDAESNVSIADPVGLATPEPLADDPSSPGWPEESESLLLPEDRLADQPTQEAFRSTNEINDLPEANHDNEIRNENATVAADPELDTDASANPWTDAEDSNEDAGVQQFAAEFTAAAQEEADQIREARLSQEWTSENPASENAFETDDEPNSMVQEVEAELNAATMGFDLDAESQTENPWATVDLDRSFDDQESSTSGFTSINSAEEVDDVDDVETPSPLSLADQLIRDLNAEKSGSESEEQPRHEDDMADTGTQMWDGQTDYAANLDSDVAQFEPANLDETDDVAEPNQEALEASGTQSYSWDQPESDESFDVAEEYESTLADVEVEPVGIELPSTEETTTETVVASDSDEPDDDSIEAYMNRLLQRVQKQSGTDSEPETPKSPKTVAKPVVSQLPVAETIESELETITPVDPDAPLIPRSQAPERNSNLSAMRELANESARSAVERSAKSQTHSSRVQAMVKFMQAAVAIICGIAAVAFVAQGMLKIVAAVAALLIAVICVKEGMTLLSVARNRSTKPSKKTQPETVDAEIVE